MIQFFDAGMLQYVAWVAALLPLLAIDLWTFYCTVLRGREPEWRGTALAVIIGMALNLPLIRGFYQLDSADDLAYAAAIVLTGVAMSWLAHQVAGWMLRQDRAEAVEAVERQVIKPAVSFGIAGGACGFHRLFRGDSFSAGVRAVGLNRSESCLRVEALRHQKDLRLTRYLNIIMNNLHKKLDNPFSKLLCLVYSVYKERLK